MLIIQSRYQGIFNRIYLMFAHFFWYIAIGGVLALFTEKYPDDITTSLYTLVAVIVAFSIWLAIFNTGRSKIIEHGLELTEQGVTYINYGDKLTIKWTSFVGFTIKNRFPRLVLLKSADSEHIEFSYYMFSSTQRREMFQYLANK